MKMKPGGPVFEGRDPSGSQEDAISTADSQKHNVWAVPAVKKHDPGSNRSPIMGIEVLCLN
jgi:hypothetical protein